ARAKEPADFGASSERDHRDALVAEHSVNRLDLHRHDLKRRRGKARREEDLAEQKRGERRARAWLDDYRIARGKCGRDLVRDEVEREVERRDAEDDAAREAFSPARSARAG